jgi:glycosyltransferase involved in cell wall biosynthesis
MVKKSGLLCRMAGPLDCHLCFPDISAPDFFMRELFVKSFLVLVDWFVCPSQFLRDRYVAWGLPPGKMVVLENGQPRPNGVTAEDSQTLETKFVVLGQLSQRKGTLVLLDAARLLPARLRKTIRIEIHGSLQYSEDNFKTRFEEALQSLQDTVHFCGPYRAEDVAGIFRRNGWLIVPSIWWENSPLVIQEAFAAGRPVICSNIGGMAEKVAHGVSGVHFLVGNAADLAAQIEQCATDPALWRKLCSGVPQPPTIDQTVDRLLALYCRRPMPASAAASAGDEKQNYDGVHSQDAMA